MYTYIIYIHIIIRICVYIYIYTRHVSKYAKLAEEPWTWSNSPTGMCIQVKRYVLLSQPSIRYRQDCKQRRFSKLWAVLPLCYVKQLHKSELWEQWTLATFLQCQRDTSTYSHHSHPTFQRWRLSKISTLAWWVYTTIFLGMHMSNVWIRKNLSKLSCRRWCRSWTWDLRRRGRRSLCWLGISGAQRVWTFILHAMFWWKDYVHSI